MDAVAAVVIPPDVAVLAALEVKLQQAVAVLVALGVKLQQAVLAHHYDIPLLRYGAGGVYNNTSYDFYNNIFFAVPAKMLLLPGMQQ